MNLIVLDSDEMRTVAFFVSASCVFFEKAKKKMMNLFFMVG